MDSHLGLLLQLEKWLNQLYKFQGHHLFFFFFFTSTQYYLKFQGHVFCFFVCFCFKYAVCTPKLAFSTECEPCNLNLEIKFSCAQPDIVELSESYFKIALLQPLLCSVVSSQIYVTTLHQFFISFC